MQDRTSLIRKVYGDKGVCEENGLRLGRQLNDIVWGNDCRGLSDHSCSFLGVGSPMSTLVCVKNVLNKVSLL
jgi:hypothetical protein